MVRLRGESPDGKPRDMHIKYDAKTDRVVVTIHPPGKPRSGWEIRLPTSSIARLLNSNLLVR